MAVKQKNVGSVAGVTPSAEARLQIILRALQDLQTNEGSISLYAHIVMGLGTVTVPSDPATYMKFIEDIKSVQNILVKECANKEIIFVTLKALYDEISNPNKSPSPVMSIVLQLMDIEQIPGAVKFILNSGYPEQNLERALYTLCNWLTKWTWTPNLGPLVLAFMEGLESEQHFEILMEVTLATIEPLFKLLILPLSRACVWPVVHHMLTRVQHDPQVFHKIIPHIPKLIQILSKEEISLDFLKSLVHLCAKLMEHFPGHLELYEPLKKVLAPHFVGSSYTKGLDCEAWADGVGLSFPVRGAQGKVGLYNLGNTCYMNSVLQALFMTKTFRNEILLHNKKMMPLFDKLQVLFALLQHSKKISLSPNEILKLLRPPGFLLGHQHDSSEFLGFLLDTLHEQEKSVGGGDGAAGEPIDSVELLPTIVQQSFGGKTVTVSHCNGCGTKSEKIDNFRELSLSFPSNSDNQSVQDLLSYYLQPEQLCGDNQYRCDVCDGLTDGERITKIVEAPARLILTLKHFRYDPTSQTRTKLLQRVKLDSQISLEGAQFDLYAAVVHCGTSVDSGHYYTFAKDGSEWYKFNDCSVIKASEEELLCLKPPETPYILFYSREDLSEPANLPCTVLSANLQLILTKDASESDLQNKNASLYRSIGRRPNHRNNDDPPPPGCGGVGFSATSGNMFVC